MVVEGSQHPRHPIRVVRVPRHGRPVGVPDDDAASWHQRPPHCGERSCGVGYVLEHLDGHGRVERLGLQRRFGGVALAQLHVRQARATRSSQLEHVGARVHAHHPAARPHLRRELGHAETGTAADIDDPLSGLGLERGPHQPATLDHVASAIHAFEPTGRRLIELHPSGHPPRMPRFTCSPRRLSAQMTVGNTRQPGPRGCERQRPRPVQSAVRASLGVS